MLVNYVKINKSNISSRKLDLANIADKTQYYSSEFKKMRCKIQSVEVVNLAEFLLKLF